MFMVARAELLCPSPWLEVPELIGIGMCGHSVMMSEQNVRCGRVAFVALFARLLLLPSLIGMPRPP